MLALSIGFLPGGSWCEAPRAVRFRNTAADKTAEIAAVANEVDVNRLKDYMIKLRTGEGAERGYKNKEAQPDLIAARAAIADELTKEVGADNLSTQPYVVNGYSQLNIIGVHPGVGKRKADLYVIGAHYDSVQNPGADDNASGVAGMLEAARVLTDHEFGATLVFVAFDQEELHGDEQYAQGSKYFVHHFKKKHIKAAIVLDTIAFRPGGDVMSISRCDKEEDKDSAAAKLLHSMGLAVHRYGGLKHTSLDGENSSDTVRFFKNGIPAVLVTEEYDRKGWPINPYYHEDSDFYLGKDGNPQQYKGRDYLDMEYASKIVKGVVGWAATQANLRPDTE